MTNAGCEDVEGCLGRRFYSEKNARRARNRRTPHSEFMPPTGKTPHSPAGPETPKPPNLSVDGLRVAALGQLADIARADEESRDGPFRGWAYVTRELARQEGRRVVAAPTPKNPYHEEIHLPAKVAGNRDALKQHATHLADNASWCEGR